LLEVVFSAPPEGPVKVKPVAGANGETEPDALEAALVPNAFVAVTEHV
jgi:hypothetical protein